MIVLLSFWPSILSVDSVFQWNQVQANDINDAHPFYHTLLLLFLSKIWNSTTIVAIFQIICFALIWTYICKYFSKKIEYKYNFIFHVLYIIFMLLVPLIYIYSITIWKDILYSYVLLFMAMIFLVLDDKKYQLSYKNIIFLSILILLTSLFRHNGLIVFVLSSIFIIVKIIHNKIGIKKLLVFIFACLILYSATSAIKVNYLKSNNKEIESASAIDNYIVFMLSSYMHNGLKLDIKDEKIVYSIMTKRDWIENYDPYSINFIQLSPSKNNDVIKKYSKELKQIIIKYSIKKPILFLKHYIDADNLLWNPTPKVVNFIYPYSENNKYGFDYLESPIFKNSNNFLTKVAIHSLYNNLTSIFYIPALIMYLSIIITILICIISKKIKYIVMLFPMIFNIISLAPINLAQDLRYVYINYLTFFLVLFVLTNLIIQKIVNKDINKK